MNPMISVTLIVLTFATLLRPMQSWENSAHPHMPKREAAYDGKWWSVADSEEKRGFLNGTADCLISTAHQKWITRSVEWAIPKIAEYYKTHVGSEATPVPEAWHSVISEAPHVYPPKGGELFTNPHGYYDGLYWRQSDASEQLGFLEGYFLCLRTQVQSPTETYSRPVDYYVEKINAYLNNLKAHPNGDDQAIATILFRFRDKPKEK